MTLGQRISAGRKAKGLTQKQLALQLNVSDKAVSRWERDESEPDIQSLQGLSLALGTTVDLLVTGSAATEQTATESKYTMPKCPIAHLLVFFGSLISIFSATVIDPVVPGENWAFLPFLVCVSLSIWSMMHEASENTPDSIQLRLKYGVLFVTVALFTIPTAFSTELISILGLGCILAEMGFVSSTALAWFLITPALIKRGYLPDKPAIKKLRKSVAIKYGTILITLLWIAFAAGFYQELYFVIMIFLTVPITAITALLYQKAK